MAGAERLICELAAFALSVKLQPVVLIANNYNIEYYDAILKKMDVNVIRTTLQGIKFLRNPINFLKALFWQIKLKHFAEKTYDSVHVIGLYNVPKVQYAIIHSNRYFWHVGNAVQYFDAKYPFPESIFKNEGDTLIYINPYQENEIIKQYGKDNIKCKVQIFKLFLTEP